jgi:hypothetical protein
VADVMSASYAARFNILPVELSADTLVVATADPYARVGSRIAKISRRVVRRVIANPLDIAQYITQFFSLAKSIKKANKSNGNDLALRNNFEQLVERARATNRSTPTTSTSSTSSTGCGSTRLSSAPPTSTWNPSATWRRSASASTACCTRSTRCRRW